MRINETAKNLFVRKNIIKTFKCAVVCAMLTWRHEKRINELTAPATIKSVSNINDWCGARENNAKFSHIKKQFF
jgi:hypothetical protein